jgi:transposase
MFGIDLYGRARLAVLGQGLSQRKASRRFGIDRGTVPKMVSHSAPPGYRRSVEPRCPKLDRHSGFIDQILANDLSAPKKQRHTIQRIYDRLRDERGATIITSNLPFDEWTATFGEERLTGALLDRLTHHVHILEMNGLSYRLAQSRSKRKR